MSRSASIIEMMRHISNVFLLQLLICHLCAFKLRGMPLPLNMWLQQNTASLEILWFFEPLNSSSLNSIKAGVQFRAQGLKSGIQRDIDIAS
jgi:hypothetical protein